ncbi:MAG: cyclodeaminase/cyclohydrolase family protein [Ktedonobacteraceae bacterium]|nr:cyclodeaminase/cyclohydrolase family protein [Ktedonobacteraceae bacterium]
MYLDEPLRKYLNDLASASPAPGGGSAAALSGALGAALACMVARLTQGKAKYADVQPEIEDLLQKTEQLRERFQQLIQEDIEAYGRLSAAFKLPRETEEQRAERTRIVQERLKEAALVPLEVVERAAELMDYCQRIAQIGNVNVLSDIAVAAMMATGAATGASWMVRTNLQALKDQELVLSLSERLDMAMGEIEAGRQQVISRVGEDV